MTDNKLGIVARQEISYDLFEGILVTALEGGSNYWYMIDLNDTGVPDTKYPNEPNSVRVAKMIWYDKINLRVLDIEDQEVLLGEVNLTTIKTAFERICSQYPETYLNLIKEEYDADDADVFFQIATMGEVTFG
tara:strand:- start:542 stop:940 length:399 start_codon:yes stop_codon:yes gene_type:complete